LGRGRGPGYLERARAALLNVLAESLDEEQRRRTTVVFDAKSGPPDVADSTTHRGITVRFAAGHASADELIEQLIKSDSAPRRLTVVSGDRRIQQAAKRRKAKAIDSDTWWDELLQSRARRSAGGEPDTHPREIVDPFPESYFDDLDGQ
jgi:predicted RNA-binding protein with PIN domain